MKRPIVDFVEKYAKSDTARFHMPGHKGRDSFGIAKYDITEIPGADVLYSPDGIILESESNATEIFHTGHTFYSAEGSTLAIKAMLALTKANSKSNLILAARNAHKAFLYASALLDIEVKWLYSDGAEHIASFSITCEEIEREILSLNQKPMAVYITTPDYLGGMLDVRKIGEVCKKHSIPLLVDNAHGAYLGFTSENLHPIALGASMCADSAHKTLFSLTGGAYLHIAEEMGEKYIEGAREYLSLFASTSPSYLILASLDAQNPYLAGEYKKRLSDTVSKIKIYKNKLRDLGYEILDTEPLKITLRTTDYGYTGYEVSEILRKNLVECEYADYAYTVLMCTSENSESDFERLYLALKNVERKPKIPYREPKVPHGKFRMSVRDALFSEKETLKVDFSLGRIVGGISVSCPPAVPLVIAGEEITDEVIALLKFYGVEKISVVK